MRCGLFASLGCVFLLTIFFSCAGRAASPVQEPAAPPAPSASSSAEENEIITAPPEKPPAQSAAIKTEDSSVEITHEEYRKTFDEVEAVIEELNSIIKAGDYERWHTHLTQRFIAEIMNPHNIDRINEQPILKRNNIVIKTLGDYFMYVVAPSRTSVQLDDLVFTDADRVKAFMFVRENRVLIYQLEKKGGKWKISIW
jgi:hypothetical protein